MSREFGNYSGSEYFHSKIESALEDAKGGSTNGAKLMATFLEPLAKIAYAVSSHEAGDSGEDFVVEVAHEQVDELQRAVGAMREFIRPAHELAVAAVAKTLSGARIEEVEKGKAWRVYANNIPWNMGNEVATEIVRQKFKLPLLYSGSSTSCNGETYYSVVTHDSREAISLLHEEVRNLKQKLALAEVTNAK